MTHGTLLVSVDTGRMPGHFFNAKIPLSLTSPHGGSIGIPMGLQLAPIGRSSVVARNDSQT